MRHFLSYRRRNISHREQSPGITSSVGRQAIEETKRHAFESRAILIGLIMPTAMVMFNLIWSRS